MRGEVGDGAGEGGTDELGTCVGCGGVYGERRGPVLGVVLMLHVFPLLPHGHGGHGTYHPHLWRGEHLSVRGARQRA